MPRTDVRAQTARVGGEGRFDSVAGMVFKMNNALRRVRRFAGVIVRCVGLAEIDVRLAGKYVEHKARRAGGEKFDGVFIVVEATRFHDVAREGIGAVARFGRDDTALRIIGRAFFDAVFLGDDNDGKPPFKRGNRRGQPRDSRSDNQHAGSRSHVALPLFFSEGDHR
ncbi:MAG: hypothetical protein BWY39_02061 [Spirochaetes bacterium ADurb.Bin269]|nr:MAG: hypothetical protein BWY39_02061 [Spirochaetes bacterium ADurb.Bin269]